MTTTQKFTGRAMSIPASVAIGGLVSFGWTIAGAAILAKLIGSEVLAENATGYGAMLILLTASLLGSLTAFGKAKRQRAPVCLAAAGVYYFLLLSTTALFFGGQYQGMGVTALVVLAGAGTAVLLGVGPKKKKAYRMPKISH